MAEERPVGPALPDWHPRPRPQPHPLVGAYSRLEPLDPSLHAAALFGAFAAEPSGAGWTYLPYGPFPDEASFTSWLDSVAGLADPVFFAIVDERDRPVGLASYLRINPEMGSIEVGHLHFSPALQHTRAATDAMYLMMRHALDDLGYRRYEWKCDDLNAPSRRAAERLGFTYEGTFRQDRIYKGRNRDTAWYSIVDSEWPAIKDALEAWLDPDNFDEAGAQRRRLGDQA